jgi:allantoinase
VLDWPNDEQPYRMTVPKGELVSLPTLVELDDVYAHWHRRVTIWRWERMVKEAFDTLHADGAKNGRLLTLSLHPWLIGQPHRIKSLDDALAYICEHANVWPATGREIADWYLRQC